MVREYLCTQQFRLWWRIPCPVYLSGIGLRFLEGYILLCRFLIRKVIKQLVILCFYILQKGCFLFFVQQVSRHRHATAGVEYIHHTIVILRGYFHSSVHTAGGSAAYQQRLLHATAFHFFGHMHHLIQRWRDEPAQAYEVHIFSLCGIQYLIGRHHHAQVYHFVAVTAQHHTYYVLAYIMHIALYGGHQYFCGPCGFIIVGTGSYVRQPAGFFLRLYKWEQVSHTLLHHARTLYHLWQEHFATAKEVTYHIHTGHQRAFNHIQRLWVFGTCFFSIRVYKISNAVYKGVLQPFFHLSAAPCVIYLNLFAFRFYRICKYHKALCGIGVAVQHHIFAQLTQLRLYLIVHY